MLELLGQEHFDISADYLYYHMGVLLTKTLPYQSLMMRLGCHMLRNQNEHQILYHPKLHNYSMKHFQYNRFERSDNCSSKGFHFELQRDQGSYIQIEESIHKSGHYHQHHSQRRSKSVNN